MECLELRPDARERLEELHGLLDRHVQYLRDVLSAEVNLESLAVVASAVTYLARHLDVRKELHLDLDVALALTRLAAAALDIEREAAGFVAAQARFRHRSEHLAHRRKGAGVGSRVGAGCAADRGLVDHNDFIQLFEARDCIAFAGPVARAVK